MYVCSLYIVWFCSCEFYCLIMDYNLCNLYNCMYVCTYIVRYGMCVCICMFVGEHVCRPSLLCNPVYDKIDNNII